MLRLTLLLRLTRTFLPPGVGKRASPAKDLPPDQLEANQEADKALEEEHDFDAPLGSDVDLEVSLRRRRSLFF